MQILIGFIGAFLILLVWLIGVVIGWALKELDYKRTTAAVAEELGDVDKQRIKEEQEAFNILQNYNADMAYGTRQPAKGGDST